MVKDPLLENDLEFDLNKLLILATRIVLNSS